MIASLTAKFRHEPDTKVRCKICGDFFENKHGYGTCENNCEEENLEITMENRKLITKNWLIGSGFEHGIWPHNFTLGNRDEEGFIVYNVFNKTISFNHCIIPTHLIEYQQDLLDMIAHLKSQRLVKNKYDKDVYSRKVKEILKDSEENG